MSTTMVAGAATSVHRRGLGPGGATALALSAVWLAVLVLSIFAPDMVHGSRHEHLRVAAMTAWFWGLMATVFVLLPLIAYREPGPRHGPA